MSERLSDVAERGDRRSTLVALRRNLALQLEASGPRDAAGLARQMQAVLREIEEIPTAAEENPDDEIRRKREERRRRSATS